VTISCVFDVKGFQPAQIPILDTDQLLYSIYCWKSRFSYSIFTNMGRDSQAVQDVYIAVMGMTGAGKSSFIATCSGKSVKIGHNLKSCRNPQIIIITRRLANSLTNTRH